jgi:hypothetical protein
MDVRVRLPHGRLLLTVGITLGCLAAGLALWLRGRDGSVPQAYRGESNSATEALSSATPRILDQPAGKKPDHLRGQDRPNVSTRSFPEEPRTLPFPDEFRASLSAPRSRVQVNATVEELEKRWSSELPNEEWSWNTHTFIEAMLESVGGNIDAIDAVRCGTTICKVEVNATDHDGVVRLGFALQKEGVVFHALSRDNDAGSGWVAYFAREGSEREVFSKR